MSKKPNLFARLVTTFSSKSTFVLFVKLVMVVSIQKVFIEKLPLAHSFLAFLGLNQYFFFSILLNIRNDQVHKSTITLS